MSIREYFDIYIKTPLDGLCKYCGSITGFISKGYKDFCSQSCATSACNKKRRSKKLEKFNHQCMICQKFIDYTYYSKKDTKTCSYKCTMQLIYGVDNIFQLEQIKEKSKQTLLEKYGVENISKNNDIKLKKEETCFKHNGVKYASKSKIIRDKTKKTNLERYGVENPMHNKDIAERAVLNGGGRCSPKRYLTIFGNTIIVQGSFEMMFVKECEKNNIPIKNGPWVEYLFQDKLKRYFIDFEIDCNGIKKLVEIKSTYYFEKYKEQVLAKQNAANVFAYSNNMIYELKIFDKNRKEIEILLKNFRGTK